MDDHPEDHDGSKDDLDDQETFEKVFRRVVGGSSGLREAIEAVHVKKLSALRGSPQGSQVPMQPSSISGAR